MRFGELQAEKLSGYWENDADSFQAWIEEELRGESRSELEILLDRDLSVVDAGAVGAYGIDVLARDSDTGEQIVLVDCVTNEEPDVLASLAGSAEFGADVVVWIGSSFSEKHLDSIAWLAGHTTAVEFVLVQLEIWRIDDSEPAIRAKRVTLDSTDVSQFEGPPDNPTAVEKMSDRLRAINGRLWRAMKYDGDRL